MGQRIPPKEPPFRQVERTDLSLIVAFLRDATGSSEPSKFV